jgi:hypothetical protein
MAYHLLMSVAFTLAYITLAFLVMAGSSLIAHQTSRQRARNFYQASLGRSGTRVMIETGIFVAAIGIMLASMCLGYIWHGLS